MPGYLIKTAYFVAEIANDDELIQLAKNDTVKKDTKICVQPGKNWIDARHLPILREVWGLDSEVIPPPIKMPQKSPEEQANSETVIDYRPDFIPPGREVSDCAEQSREPVVPSVSSHVMQNISEKALEDDDDECSMPGIPLASVHEMLQIKPKDNVAPSESNSDLEIQPRSETAEFNALIKDCGKQVDKIENLQNVSHTWVLDNGISTQNLPHSEVELEARAIGEQRAEEELRQSSALNQEVQRTSGGGFSDVVSVVKETIDMIADDNDSADDGSKASSLVDENVSTFVEAQSELESEASGESAKTQESQETSGEEAMSAVDRLLPKSSLDTPSEKEFAEKAQTSDPHEANQSEKHPQEEMVDEHEDLFGKESGLSGQAWQVVKAPSVMMAFGQELLEPDNHISMVSLDVVEPPGTSQNVPEHENAPEGELKHDATETDMEPDGGDHDDLPKDVDKKELSDESEEHSDSINTIHDESEKKSDETAESVQKVTDVVSEKASSSLDAEVDDDDLTRLDYARNLEAVSVDVEKKVSGSADEDKIEETKRVELSNILNTFSKNDKENVPPAPEEPVLDSEPSEQSESSEQEEGEAVKSKNGETLEVEVDRLLLESSGISEDQKPNDESGALSESDDNSSSKEEQPLSQSGNPSESSDEENNSEREHSNDLLVASGLSVPLLDGTHPVDENSNELHAAIEALKRETQKDESADPSSLIRAQSLLQAIEKPRNKAEQPNDDMLDEAPSEVFTVYNRNDVLRGIQSSNSNPSISAVHRSIDEEGSRSELRRMLEAEVRAVESEDMPALDLSRDLATSSAQGDIRSLFEKEDELHLYPDNGSNGIISEVSNAPDEKETARDTLPNAQREKSLTDELPIRNDKVVVHDSAPVMAESTILTPIKDINKNAVEAIPNAKETVFEIKLQEGESEIARYNSLVLSTHRLWNFEGKGFACYDVDTIQWHSLKQKTRLWVFAIFGLLVIGDGIYYCMSPNPNMLIAGIILVWLLLVLAFVYLYYSYSTTLNIGFAGTNISKKVPRADIEKVKEFLEKVEEAKNNRRLSLGK